MEGLTSVAATPRLDVTRAQRTLVRTDGARLAVTDWGGEGPPFVLVHGLTSSQEQFNALAAELSDRCRVVTYDQRYHGRSTGNADYSWAAFVGDLEAVLAELELRDVTLVGHSFGAGIVLDVGARSLDCRALALLDGALPVAETAPHGGRLHLFVRSLVMFARWILLRPFHRVHSLSSSKLRQVGNDYRGRHAQYESDLRALACPTMLLLGSEVEAGQGGPPFQKVRREAALRTAQANPDIDVQWINARHDMIMTHPKEIAASLFRLRALD